MDRRTNRLTDRWIERQNDEQTGVHTDIMDIKDRTDVQTGRWTNRRMGRETDGDKLIVCTQKDKKTQIQTNRWAERLMDRQTDGKTDRWRQTDGQTDSITDRWTDRWSQTNGQIDRWTDTAKPMVR